jgi:hypothetical protein
MTPDDHYKRNMCLDNGDDNIDNIISRISFRGSLNSEQVLKNLSIEA